MDVYSVRAAATLLVLQATGGFAVTSWLPTDSQVVYRIAPGEIRRLELNTSHIPQTPVYITVSPCSRDFRWEVYSGSVKCDDDKLKLIYEVNSADTRTFTKLMSNLDRYVLQLSSISGGAAVVSARGEPTHRVRLRLRARSKRRLFASWDPSPIDPQATTYCVVASHKRNYTSLCAAQNDVRLNRLQNKSNLNAGKLDFNARHVVDTNEDDNKIYKETGQFDMYEENFKSYYRRKKFSRSTRITDEDPVIACIGDRTHHTIENLDSTKNYYVSVFGIGNDKRAGSILALATLRPKSATARRLRPDQPYKAELKNNRVVFYYKGAFNVGDGLWLAVTACGGAVDVEVLVRGKRISFHKNIDPHTKFFSPAPVLTSSAQDISDEGSVQFDSNSSEESRLKYVIKVAPSWRDGNDNVVHLEVLASLNQWGANSPELAPLDGAVVREIRPRRACRSLYIAFLPATHNTADYIRYCTTARETGADEGVRAVCCSGSKGADVRQQCMNQSQRARSKVIMQKITGLRAGRKYVIQVTAATKNIAVPYNILYAHTNSCKN